MNVKSTPDGLLLTHLNINHRHTNNESSELFKAETQDLNTESSDELSSDELSSISQESESLTESLYKGCYAKRKRKQKVRSTVKTRA